MNTLATRPRPHDKQTGNPLKAKPCGCSLPLADPREMTCHYCGHQVGGVPLPARNVAFAESRDTSRPATGRRKYPPAP